MCPRRCAGNRIPSPNLAAVQERKPTAPVGRINKRPPRSFVEVPKTHSCRREVHHVAWPRRAIFLFCNRPSLFHRKSDQDRNCFSSGGGLRWDRARGGDVRGCLCLCLFGRTDRKRGLGVAIRAHGGASHLAIRHAGPRYKQPQRAFRGSAHHRSRTVRARPGDRPHSRGGARTRLFRPDLGLARSGRQSCWRQPSIEGQHAVGGRASIPGSAVASGQIFPGGRAKLRFPNPYLSAYRLPIPACRRRLNIMAAGFWPPDQSFSRSLTISR